MTSKMDIFAFAGIQEQSLPTDRFDRAMAVLIGLSIPSISIGRAAIGITLGIAVILLLRRLVTDRAYRFMLSGLKTPIGILLSGVFAWAVLSSIFSYEPAGLF